MRISIDASSLSYPKRTGIGRMLECLLPRMVKQAQGEMQFVFVSGQPLHHPVALSLVESHGVEALTASFPSLFLWQQLFMHRQVRQAQAQIHICFEGLRPLFLPCASLGIANDLLWHRLPDTLAWHVRTVYRLRQHSSLKHHKAVLAISRFTQSEYRSYFGSDADHVEAAALPGVDTALFRPLQPEDETQRIDFLQRFGLKSGYFVCLGNVMEHKNLQCAVRAWQRLAQQQTPPPQLAVIGLGGNTLEEFSQDELSRLGIISLGYLSDEDVRMALRSSAGLIFPSRYEGFGLPVLEAMASGVPIAISTAPALLEAAGNACLTFSPDSPQQLADAVTRLIHDESLRHTLIAAGHVRAQERSWDRGATELLMTLRRIAQ